MCQKVTRSCEKVSGMKMLSQLFIRLWASGCWPSMWAFDCSDYLRLPLFLPPSSMAVINSIADIKCQHWFLQRLSVETKRLETNGGDIEFRQSNKWSIKPKAFLPLMPCIVKQWPRLFNPRQGSPISLLEKEVPFYLHSDNEFKLDHNYSWIICLLEYFTDNKIIG